MIELKHHFHHPDSHLLLSLAAEPNEPTEGSVLHQVERGVAYGNNAVLF
jgi:hypothetical protein